MEEGGGGTQASIYASNFTQVKMLKQSLCFCVHIVEKRYIRSSLNIQLSPRVSNVWCVLFQLPTPLYLTIT